MGAARRIALWLCASFAALAACGADNDPGAPVSVAALPHPKAGLWRWSSGVVGVKDLCLSGQVLSVLEPRPGCPAVRQVVTRNGAYIVEAHCPTGAVRRLYARAWGDFDRVFWTDVTVGEAADHAEYRYLGACAPGQKPDDTP